MSAGAADVGLEVFAPEDSPVSDGLRSERGPVVSVRSAEYTASVDFFSSIRFLPFGL
jgi:hypothetical protein